ncbi:hypothetical protein DI270_018965 [Microbispora triticiradicis]|uniref:WxL domain-containing protein n=3 Tax=Microbispora TaxID=2005 RepID=A0ABY3LN31_9ACTN|nr:MULTISPECIES: hypothetical protein [Microbispora]RGA03444.1 hypothetical protein DI270_018965 [Microbispora triticiradicis]TLP59480.1 hypothetical protein FED44_14260 [Microbispora fusca]TYB41686.1 hypothetical protein FXF59_35070 [Microbispora tritici]GLW22848.1 hypothetical protein Mame01_28910 [Microbispora amethystogenes]
MRRPFFLAAAASLALGLMTATALPALADTADTVVTFTITGGSLTISAPASVNLGSVVSGATSISGQIGPVTVTDQRGTLNGTWTATAISTDFTTGGATPHETIPNINVTYSPGPATATTGTGTFTPGPGGIINVPRVAFTGTELQGNNSATWNPTLTINIPSGTVAGTYTGTVTHSVG